MAFITVERVEAKLDELAELEAQQALLEAEWERLKREAIPPEVRAELDDIDSEMAPKVEFVQEQREALTKIVKEAVVALGEKVRGSRYQAIYNEGRTTVDMKKLAGYAVAHPEVAAMLKYGKPYVTLRKIDLTGAA